MHGRAPPAGTIPRLSTEEHAVSAHLSRIAVPASLFGTVLGLAGLGNGWRIAARLWQQPAFIGELVLAVAAAVWALLMVLYAAKWMVARPAARAEVRHPVQSGFVALVPLTTMLMALAVLPHARGLAMALWLAGAAGQLAYGAASAARLWQGGRDAESTTTVLYLPTVGVNFVAAFVAGELGLRDWGVFFFGIGLFAWLSLESVILHRQAVGPPLPPPARATLGIQLAPPVVGASAWLSLTAGAPDLFVQGLFAYGVLQALFLLRLWRWFAAQGFSAGLWAFTFGVTAIANVAMRMSERGASGPPGLLALPLFVFANLFVGTLAVLTLRQLWRGQLLPAPAAAPPAVPERG
jgi:tellurite resistance protein